MCDVTTSSWVMASTMSAPLRSCSLNSSSMPARPLRRHSSIGCSTGMSISWPPIAFISSRMIDTTRWCTRQPAGSHDHRPAPTWRMSPARTISLCESASASDGASFSVGSRYVGQSCHVGAQPTSDPAGRRLDRPRTG